MCENFQKKFQKKINKTSVGFISNREKYFALELNIDAEKSSTWFTAKFENYTILLSKKRRTYITKKFLNLILKSPT